MIADQNFLVIVGAVVNIVVVTGGVVWALSRVEARLRDTINEHRTDTEDEFVKVRKEFGETAAALRQKVTEIELWGRDNFVKKDTFTQVMDRVEKNIEQMGDRIEARLLRMETKIDKQNND